MFLGTGLTDRERETDRLTIGDYTELVTHALNDIALSTLQELYRKQKEKENKENSPHTVQVQCCFTSTESLRTIRDGEPKTATSTFTQLLSSDSHSTVQERGGERERERERKKKKKQRKQTKLKTTHSSSSMLLYVHRDHKDY